MILRKVIKMDRHNPLFSFWAPFILAVLEFSFHRKDTFWIMGLLFLLAGHPPAQLCVAYSVFEPLASEEGPL